MKLATSQKIKTTKEELWPLLFNSKMDGNKPCRFLMGLPKPMECKLGDKEGGVGKTRLCVSDKGIIKQNILEWYPNEKLVFEMKETDIYFGPCVESILESFTISTINSEWVKITRETEIHFKKHSYFLIFPMYIGLKSIHKYVFKNWKNLAE